MKKINFKPALITPVLLLGMVACTTKEPPTIASLSDQELKIQRKQSQDINPENVIAKYRDFLKNAPVENMYSNAKRRVADLELSLGEEQSFEGDDANAGTAQLNSAVTQYKHFLKTHPGDPDNELVLYQLAKAYSLLAQPKKEQQTLDIIIKRFPNTRYQDEVQFRRGETLFLMKDYKASAAAYGAIVNYNKASLYYKKALYKYGWSYFKLGQYDVALNKFIQLLDENNADGKLGRIGLANTIGRADKELLLDTLRVTSLTLSYQDGPRTLSKFISTHGNKDYEPLLYRSLGDLYREKQRVIDAADTYIAYVKRFPNDPDAPIFHQNAIKAYEKGNFKELLLAAKIDFANRYGKRSYYWQTQTNQRREFIEPLLQKHISDLATHFHANARKSKKTSEYQQSAKWYGEYLKSFPKSNNAAKMNFLYAEALAESRNYKQAVIEFEKTAFTYPAHSKSSEAAYAAVLLYPKIARSLPKEQQSAWQQKAIASSLIFATRFESDPRAIPVLAKTSEQLYQLKDYTRARDTAKMILPRITRKTPSKIIKTAWTVIGHSEFELKNYKQAEAAYYKVRDYTPKKNNAKQLHAIEDRLAASIYKQGEQAKLANKPNDAIGHFLRVKTVAPRSNLIVNAEYDAATMLIELKRYSKAQRTLENFRRKLPRKHKLQTGITEKLAFIYIETGQNSKAAREIERMLAFTGTPEQKRIMTLQVADLYNKSKNYKNSVRMYKSYIKKYPRPLDDAMDSRQKLADYYKSKRKLKDWGKELRGIIKADHAAGAARTERSKYLAASAMLILAKPTKTAFKKARLTTPLKKSLKKKKRLMQKSIKAYEQSISYGVGQVTTSATYEIAEIYNEFSRELLRSPRPKGLSGDEREQYTILLEEQAYPFEEKAIDIHAANVKQVSAGLYDKWVKKSLKKLQKLQPGRYDKKERVELYVTSPN